MTTKTLTDRSITAAVLAATLTLTGCTPTPPTDRPDVIWPDGEPTGPLEDSPWVQAVRASYRELAISHFLLNFDTQELTRTTSSAKIADYKLHLSSEAEDAHWSFPPGPDPMIPIYVREAPDGQSAQVWTCVAYDWEVTSQAPTPPSVPLGVFVRDEVAHVDGNYIVAQDGAPHPDALPPKIAKAFEPYRDDRNDRHCLLDDAAVGMFDPPPDVNIQYTADDIQ